jgi:hypothetical protein
MKCLFDNCLPKKLAKTLHYLEGDDGMSVIHLSDQFPSNTPDIEWIHQLSKEGGWFVITRDNQIKKKPHEIKAWQEANLPIVFLQKSWMNFDFWNIAWRIIRYWPDIKGNMSKLQNYGSIILTINGKINPVNN